MKSNSVFSVVLMQMTFAVALFACTNSLITSKYSSVKSTSTTTTSSSPTATMVISNVTIGGLASNTVSSSPTPTATSTATVATNIYFNTSTSTQPILNHCNVTSSGSSATSKPCLCQFKWNQTNTTSGSAVTISRIVKTAITSAQSYVVACNAPEVYSSEIPNGTQINITVIPDSSNGDSSLFTVNTFTYTKNTTTSSGSFKDSQGHSFDNVYHYGCYQKFKRGMTIQSKLFQKTNQFTSNTMNAMIGTQFCIATGNSQVTTTCPNLPTADYSSQSNYFNFYIRNSELGDINQFNDGYVCPLVKESLGGSATIGTQNKPWPLDTNFALSLAATTDFTIGVEAHTKLSNGNDPTASTNTCYTSSSSSSTSTGSANSSSMITSCLGFAAPTNTDGTCPAITDSSGKYRSTYRLRRFVAIYPRTYDTNGSPLSNKSQDIDTIYVLDRPVKGPASSSTYDPISKPYTMYGPKPCPFSYYDKKNVTSSGINNLSPGYVATNNSVWSGKNIDAIELPNYDKSEESCSATLPVLSDDKLTFYLSTVNVHATQGKQHVYIRPVQPFFPHYEEDTTFKGCAPQSDPIVDPPLHFSRDPVSGNVGWCAEAYPTQNSSIAKVDPAVSPSPTGTIVSTYGSGVIPPFTSHVVKNTASTACSGSALTLTPTSSYIYPPAPSSLDNSGYARHTNKTIWSDTFTGESFTADKTCDRTVNTTGLAWPTYPLLAREGDVESALSTDAAYFCTITYDGGGGKTGISTPTDGCCDKSIVNVPTGSSANGTLGTTGASTVGHLEPDVSCKSPAY